MMISSCNCNHHFSLLPSKTLLNLSPQFPRYFPSFEISVVRYWKFPLKSCCRRTLVGTSAATAADSQTLPQSAIRRIAEKLRSLGYVEESITNETTEKTQNSSPDSPSPGEIFVPLRAHLPKHRVGHTLDSSWSTPENPVPEPGSGHAIQKFHELRRGVLKEKEEERLRNNEHEKGQRVPTLAELTVPEDELRRLRTIGISLKKKLKVGKAGITEGIVNGIHERWRRSELVKIMCEDICRLNMKRTHDLLERKTGGLVIWRSGANIILYRGTDYKYPYFFNDNNASDESSTEDSPDLNVDHGLQGERRICLRDSEAVESPGLNSSKRMSHPPLMRGVGLPNRVRFQLPGEEQLVEEAEKLLEGLGPRFTDWWGYDPQPVDADLLPAIVPGFKRPFRLLPYGVKPKLTNDEMNTLRRLGHPLPCHFALGRNRKLQGLAASIIELWEKCEIAKIAIKRGVQNTNSELMADELKWLTGGTLLSRDREFISLYRGKDFLPAAVSSAVQERRQNRMVASKKRTGSMLIMNPKEHIHGTEEHSPEFEHKTMTDSMLTMNPKEQKHGTEEHSPEFELNEKRDQKLQGRSELRKLRFSDEAIEKTSAKMSMALAKKARAEKIIAELEKQETPQPPEMDKEGITEEERYMLRKVGLRMKPFLLLGRRGVFDGTVENMHLHWKYRELIKVLVSSRKIEEVHGIARTLETESGGILVAVERVSKGYAIIIYRGKNYKRPASLRPQTLLSKRGAMKRSLEEQRFQSLKLHVLKLTRNIDELKLILERDKDTNGMPLDKDLKLEFDKEEIGEINVNTNEVIDKDHKSDYQSYFEYPANEKVGECHGTDATSEKPDDFIHSSGSSVLIAQQDFPGGILLQPDIDGKDVSGITKEEFQCKLLLNETPGSSNVNEQTENTDTSPCQESQDPVNALAITCSQTHFSDATVDYSTAKLESSVEKAIQKGSSVYRAPQLSNRERLVLRKQALKMKNLPVLAIGKRNIVMGVAKAIKAHFKKHSLAIVNIKGRAKGTSIQEVIYNLERATGAVLVSQEPSKVILYKQLEAGDGRAQGYRKGNEGLKNEYLSGERKTQQLVSPELISAIRLECGLKSANKETSNVTADGSTEKPNFPNDN